MRRVMAGMHIPDLDQVGDAWRNLINRGQYPAPLSQLDVLELAGRLQAAGFQAFWFYCKGGHGNAFYPSKIGHVLSTLHGRDLFGELCAACLDAGIAPLGIYESSDRRICAEHPDWTHTGDPDGRNPVDACIFSPYGDFVLEQTREVVANYPIKAYYLDALGCAMKGAWLCPTCRREFQEKFGMDFPGLSRLTHAQNVALIQWRREQLRAFTARARDLVKSIRPDMAFTFNYTGDPSTCDFVTCDLFAHESGGLALSAGLRRNAGLSRRPPGEVLIDSVAQSMRIKGRDGYASEVWTARALNVAVCGSFVMDAAGAVPAHELALAAELSREQIEFEPWLEGMQPVFQVGILNSHNSRRYRPPLTCTDAVPEKARLHLNQTPPHADEFAGWASAAVAGHVLWDFVDDWQLVPGGLSRFKVLVMAGASCLSAAQVAAVREFVRAGGTLLAGGDVSLFDESGRRQPNFQLAAVLGVDLDGDLRPDYSFFMPGSGAPLQWDMGHWPVTSRPGAQVLAQAARTPSFGLNLVAPMPPYLPAWIEHPYGRGRSIYLAGMPGLQYARGGMAEDKRFLINLLRGAVGNHRPVTVDGAESVEIFAHRQPMQRRLVVNLVNQPSGTGRALRRDCFEDLDLFAPVCGMTVRFHPLDGALPRRVYLAPERRALEFVGDGDSMAVTIPPFTVHAMIVAEYAENVE